MVRTTLIESIVTRDAFAGGHRDLPPQNPGDGGKGGEGAKGRGELPYLRATMFATRESVHAALCDQRPPEKRPNLPHCYASNLRVPQSYKVVMISEYSELWEDSIAREFYGLLDTGTFEPV